MPELPDVELYREALEARVKGATLRTVVSRIRSCCARRSRRSTPCSEAVRGVSRLGKRIVFEFDDDYFLVVHLMIAGRLQWVPEGGKAPARITLRAVRFSTGTLALTEAGTKRRAALHCVHGRKALAEFDPGGLES
jgi:formamidopyrimidine-DNA glycosylase